MSTNILDTTEDWGITPYEAAFEKQKAYVQERIEDKRTDTLVFTEHSPVYTVGKRKEAHNNLLWNAADLERAGIETVLTNRGGDITYHGPGQIVLYPIVSLQMRQDLHTYLRLLEAVAIQALGSIGLATHRRPEKTGVWLEQRKIAAVGVAVRRWVTYHGIAINICPNLEHFSGIVPCGIQAQEGSVTSLEKELPSWKNITSMGLLKNLLGQTFWSLFKDFQTYEYKGPKTIVATREASLKPRL